MNFITTSFDELIELGACEDGLQALDDCMPPMYTNDTWVNVLELPGRLLNDGFVWYVETKASKLGCVPVNSVTQLLRLLHSTPVFAELVTFYYHVLRDFKPATVRLPTPVWGMALKCETMADAIALLNALHQVFGDWEEA